MRVFDRLTGTRRPEGGTAVCSAEEVRERLLAVNRESAPFRVVDGRDDGVDLIAEWKIVDAQWYEIFARAGLERVFRVRMKLDDAKPAVRTKDEEYTVEWRAGVPNLSLAASRFSGQKTSVQFGQAYAFTEELRPGEVYNYRFSTGEMKTPLQEAVTGCGWTWQGVAFGKL